MQKLKAGEITYITESVLRVLAHNRITTLIEFLQEDISKLANLTRLDFPQIISIKNEIYSKYSAPIINGSVLLDKCLKDNKFINTGIVRLDVVLEGGIPRGHIIELCGLADAGKTQLCFQLSISCAKNNDFSALYVDTKGDFSAIRIQKILDASGYSVKEMATIMSKIQVVHVWNLEEMIELLQNIKNGSIDIENTALIIIDSLPCLMLQFLGDENKIGLKLLNIFVNYIRYLSKELQITIMCVNIQTRWVEQDVIDLEDDGDQPSLAKEAYTEKRNRCLGRYWQQIPSIVLLLQKIQKSNASESQTVLTVLKHYQIEGHMKQCSLNINALGVT